MQRQRKVVSSSSSIDELMAGGLRVDVRLGLASTLSSVVAGVVSRTINFFYDNQLIGSERRDTKDVITSVLKGQTYIAQAGCSTASIRGTFSSPSDSEARCRRGVSNAHLK